MDIWRTIVVRENLHLHFTESKIFLLFPVISDVNKLAPDTRKKMTTMPHND